MGGRVVAAGVRGKPADEGVESNEATRRNRNRVAGQDCFASRPVLAQLDRLRVAVRAYGNDLFERATSARG